MEERMHGREGSAGVERERGRKKARGGEGERESVNSYFLIKQRCSQLIHLICQLEQNMAETSSPERGWEEGWRRGGWKKSLEKRQKKAGGAAVKGRSNDRNREWDFFLIKDMKVVNRRRKQGGRDEEGWRGEIEDKGDKGSRRKHITGPCPSVTCVFAAA